MSLDVLSRTVYNEDHEAFRQSVRQFLLKEVAPHQAEWAEAGVVPKDLWSKAGAVGMLCPTVPEAYGGLAWTSAITRSLMRKAPIMAG